jgi:hypothetical protein
MPVSQVNCRCPCYLLEFSDAGFQKQHRTSEQQPRTKTKRAACTHPWLLRTKGLDLLGRNISGMATGLGKFFKIWLPDRFLDRQLARVEARRTKVLRIIRDTAVSFYSLVINK